MSYDTVIPNASSVILSETKDLLLLILKNRFFAALRMTRCVVA